MTTSIFFNFKDRVLFPTNILWILKSYGHLKYGKYKKLMKQRNWSLIHKIEILLSDSIMR